MHKPGGKTRNTPLFIRGLEPWTVRKFIGAGVFLFLLFLFLSFWEGETCLRLEIELTSVKASEPWEQHHEPWMGGAGIYHPVASPSHP